MNSARARSSEASRTRIRSNVRASCPSSSGSVSTIGVSNSPSAIRAAAVSRRRMRRANSVASP